MRPEKRRTVLVIVGAALLLTGLNGIKPLHIDDPFSYRIAEQIVEHPTDPYGFEILWIQWPQPVHEELTPPVVPYWWAIALGLFGDVVIAWKLWFLPFALLLAFSLHALLRRFASGTEVPVTLMTLFSPAFLPAFNLMQDVPVVALSLTALAVYFRACEDNSLALAGAAGLIAGLATQTKYTGLGVLAVMVLHALLFRRLRNAVTTVGVALAVFFAWEWLMTLKYGQGMFFGQLGSPLWSMERSEMVIPLIRVIGGAAPVLVLIGLAALGLARNVTLVLAAAVLAAYAMLWALPAHDLLYTVLGTATVMTLAGVALRLTGLGWGTPRPPWSERRVDWLLTGWLISEVGLYFTSAPFPATRRVMGVIVAATFVVGRLAASRARSRPGSVPLVALTVLGVVLGFVFWVVDLREAMAQRAAPREALAAIHAIDPEPRVWFVGHWGFQYYAEQAGLLPVIPDVSRLAKGDWLVVPDGLHQQEIAVTGADIDRRERLELNDGIPLVTGHGYYASDTPLRHHRGARLGLTLLRLRRELIPPTAWPPEQLLRWAQVAGGETGAAAAPALRRLLVEGPAGTRAIAAEGLHALGPYAAPASADLRVALRDSDEAVRRWAALSLGRIGDAAAAEDLRLLLEDPVVDVREAASAALARLSD